MGKCRPATFVRESAAEGRPAMLEVRAVHVRAMCECRSVCKCGSTRPDAGAGDAWIVH
jgi:hypothetical protein